MRKPTKRVASFLRISGLMSFLSIVEIFLEKAFILCLTPSPPPVKAVLILLLSDPVILILLSFTFRHQVSSN